MSEENLLPDLWATTQLAVNLDRQNRDYRTALTRILKWAHREFDNECAFVDGNELFSALSDAGFEIDSDAHLVIHGERVRE